MNLNKMIKELSKALIEQILEEFPHLQTLNLSNNGKPPTITPLLLEIERLDNLEHFVYLQHLDLSNNLLGSLSGVSQLLALRELRVSHNQISSLDGMQTLVNLSVFDVSHNRVGDLREVVRLKQNSQVREVWFEGNPIAANKT